MSNQELKRNLKRLAALLLVIFLLGSTVNKNVMSMYADEAQEKQEGQQQEGENQEEQGGEPTLSPTPSPSTTPDVEPSPSPSTGVEPSPSASPEVSPSPSVSPEVSPSPSVTPEVSPSPSPTTEVDEVKVIINGWTYNETPNTPVLSNHEEASYKYKLKNDSDEKWSDETPTNAGIYSVKATYETDKTAYGEFEISPLNIGAEASGTKAVIGNIEDEGNIIYTGNEIKPTPEVSFNGNNLDSKYYNYTYENNINASTDNIKASVIINFTGNYSGSISKEFTIKKASLNLTDDNLIIDGWVAGARPENFVSVQGYEGDVSYEYKGKSVDDSEYSLDVPELTGDYICKAIIAATENYEGVVLTKEFSIESAQNKQDRHYTLSIDNWTYNESPKAPSIGDMDNESDSATPKFEYAKVIDSESELEWKIYNISEEYNNYPEDAGNYKLRATLDADETYNIWTSDEVDFVINPKEIGNAATEGSKAVIDDIAVQNYTGDNVEPVLTVKLEGIALVLGHDYEVEYYDNINESENAKATVTFKGNYKGTLEATFTIKGKDDRNVTLTLGAYNWTYGDANATPTVTEGETEYSGAVTYEYSTQGTGLNETDGWSEYTGVINVGNYVLRATIAADDTYNKAVASVSFTVEQKEIGKDATSGSGSTIEPISPQVLTDNNNPARPTLTVKLGNDTLTLATDYTVVYSNNDKVTTEDDLAKATVTFIGNYKGTLEATFVINPDPEAAKATREYELSIEGWVFGDTAPSPDSFITKNENDETNPVFKWTTSSDTENANLKEYNPSEDGKYPVNAGSYKLVVTMAANENYKSFTAEKTFSISPMTVEADIITIGDIDTNLIYQGGSQIKPEPTVTVNSVSLVKGTDYELSYENNTNASSESSKASVKVTLKGNYSGENTKEFTINKASLTGAALTINGWTVGSTPQNPANVTGIPSGLSVTYKYKTKTGSVSDYNETVPTVAGEYTCQATVAESANYEGKTLTKDFTITEPAPDKSPMTLTAPKAKYLTYNGTTLSLVTAGTATNGTIEYKLSEAGTYSTSIPTAIDAGSYSVFYRGVASEGYLDIAEASINVTIAKLPITSGMITFKDNNKTVDNVVVKSGSNIISSDNYTAVKINKNIVVTGKNNCNGEVTIQLTTTDSGSGSGNNSGSGSGSDSGSGSGSGSGSSGSNTDTAPAVKSESTVTKDDTVKDLNPKLADIPSDKREGYLKAIMSDRSDILKILNTTGTKSTANLSMSITDKSAGMTADAKKVFEDIAVKNIGASAVVARYLDLSLMMNYTITPASGSPITGNHQISNSGDYGNVITLDIPVELRAAEGKTRTYFIIRQHGDEYAIIGTTFADNKITFTTNKFSTYALAYTEETVTVNAPVLLSGNGFTSPKTGDESNIMLWIMLFAAAVAFTSAFGVVEYRRSHR